MVNYSPEFFEKLIYKLIPEMNTIKEELKIIHFSNNTKMGVDIECHNFWAIRIGCVVKELDKLEFIFELYCGNPEYWIVNNYTSFDAFEYFIWVECKQLFKHIGEKRLSKKER